MKNFMTIAVSKKLKNLTVLENEKIYTKVLTLQISSYSFNMLSLYTVGCMAFQQHLLSDTAELRPLFHHYYQILYYY